MKTFRNSILSICAGIGMMAIAPAALASHGTDSTIDAILGNGNGVYSSSYTHSSTNHDWYTLDLGVGDTVSVNLMSSGWSSYIWLYQALTEPLQSGDTLNTDYSLVSHTGGSTNNNLSYMAGALTAGQFVIQVDSYIGGSGAYTLTIAGASDAEVAEPGMLALFGLGLAGLAFARRQRRQ